MAGGDVYIWGTQKEPGQKSNREILEIGHRRSLPA